MKKPQFKGYILEEALAYLIRTTGYDLITNPLSSDPDLSNLPNGLNLRGRGANHQIDVLGELKWIPAFNFPIRLMVEAKFRSAKTGINIVREQVGILSDVNENYFTVTDGNIKPRYRYTSAIFSTSGFSKPAIDMAIAHQIPLIDLSGNSYRDLKEAINIFSETVFSNSNTISKKKARLLVNYLRKKLRNFHSDENENINTHLKDAIDALIRKIRIDYKELFVGMSLGGFMLILKEDNLNTSNGFIRYAKEKPTHDVKINWSNTEPEKWIIRPKENSDYQLTFKLPEKLRKWIYETSDDKYAEAINSKEKYFSRISVYYHDKVGDKDFIFNLKFKKENLQKKN